MIELISVLGRLIVSIIQLIFGFFSLLVNCMRIVRIKRECQKQREAHRLQRERIDKEVEEIKRQYGLDDD